MQFSGCRNEKSPGIRGVRANLGCRAPLSDVKELHSEGEHEFTLAKGRVDSVHSRVEHRVQAARGRGGWYNGLRGKRRIARCGGLRPRPRFERSIPMRRDFLKLCGLAGLGLAVPFRRRRPAPPRRRTSRTPARTTSSSTPPAAGTRRTSWTPRASTASTASTRRATSSRKGAHKFAPTKKHAKGGHVQRGLLRRVRQRAADLQRARLLGQQPLARRPLHGHRQARQPGLPDVRRARRRLPGAELPARLPDVRQLLGDRQPRRHVPRPVPAVAPEDRQRRRRRRQRAVARTTTSSSSTASRQALRDEHEAPRRAARGCRGPSAARTCSTPPRPTRRRCSA